MIPHATIHRFVSMISSGSSLMCFDSRQVMKELREAVEKAPGEVIPLLQDLDRVLKAERSYVRDSRTRP